VKVGRRGIARDIDLLNVEESTCGTRVSVCDMFGEIALAVAMASGGAVLAV